MFRSFRIGRVAGFPIDINASFLILLGIVGIWAGGVAGVLAVLLAFGSVLVHELGHALVARHLGVPVAGIELYFFGGAAKMQGQPRSAGDEIAIAAAGPAVSFAIAGLATLLAATGLPFFAMLAWINLFIGAFNLIPALPMDGGRILRAVLSHRMGFRRATEVSIKIARGFAIAFAVIGLFTATIQLILLAGVLWFLGRGELRLAQLFGATRGYGVRRPGGAHVPGEPEVMPHEWRRASSTSRDARPASSSSPEWRATEPTGFTIGSWGAFHRPRAAGGFVIRRRGGRFVIEQL